MAEALDRQDVTRLLLVENCPDELDFGAYVSFDATAARNCRAVLLSLLPLCALDHVDRGSGTALIAACRGV